MPRSGVSRGGGQSRAGADFAMEQLSGSLPASQAEALALRCGDNCTAANGWKSDVYRFVLVPIRAPAGSRDGRCRTAQPRRPGSSNGSYGNAHRCLKGGDSLFYTP